jgi:hypothetical protein
LVALVSGFALLGAQTAAADKPLVVCPTDCPYPTIADALSAASPGDTIKIRPGSYPGGFAIASDLTLMGSGDDRVLITGSNVVIETGVSVTIKGVSISDSVSGARIINLGSLELINSTVSNNTAIGGDGGAIYNIGTLILDHTTVSNNRVILSGTNGGAIFNGGTLSIKNSTITGNSADYVGGGISNAGTLTVTNSDITSNTAGFDGGGIWQGGTSTLKNTTLSGNTPNDCGGPYPC